MWKTCYLNLFENNYYKLHAFLLLLIKKLSKSEMNTVYYIRIEKIGDVLFNEIGC
jgi:hypothetical protein